MDAKELKVYLDIFRKDFERLCDENMDKELALANFDLAKGAAAISMVGNILGNHIRRVNHDG